MRRIEWLIALLMATIVAAVVVVKVDFSPTTYCVFSPHNKQAQWHDVEIGRTRGATDIELPNGGRVTLHDAIVLYSTNCPAKKDH